MQLRPWQKAHQWLCRRLMEVKLLAEQENDGRPLLSLNCDPPPEGQTTPVLYPVWAVNATALQKRAYDRIVKGENPDGSDAFDWTPRQPKDRSVIKQWVQERTEEEREALIDELLTNGIMQDPLLPRRAGHNYEG